MAGMLGFGNSTSMLMAHLEENLLNAQRWFNLDYDLNGPLPAYNLGPYAIYNFAPAQNVQAQVHRSPIQQQIAQDVEIIDNDIAIISPNIFHQQLNGKSNTYCQARKRFRRSYDAVGEEKAAIQQRNASQLPESGQIVGLPPEPPTFRCPVCLDELKEATSTKCGHIFCKACIENALAVQKKCPTCRTKFRGKTTLVRVYLPAVF